MKAMILAAGKGTRLRPLTLAIPKPMIPIGGRPVIRYIIDLLISEGVKHIMVNLHYKAEQIASYLRRITPYGAKIDYFIEPEPMGTAGAIKAVENFFDDTFIVIGGDIITNIKIGKIAKFHKQKKSLATIGLYHTKHVEQYGVVVTNSQGKILEFQEKPKKEEAKSNWINTGIYIFEPDILKLIPKNKFYDFGLNLFPKLTKKQIPFFGYKAKGYWRDIGNLEEYQKAIQDMLNNKILPLTMV